MWSWAVLKSHESVTADLCLWGWMTVVAVENCSEEHTRICLILAGDNLTSVWKITSSNDVSFYELQRRFWCQNKWHYGYNATWQVLCHVYSAVIWTSKWPCQISLEPLIMSLFFNFTAPGSSILFSIKGIILRLLTGSWQFLNDASRLPTGSFVKSLAFGQTLLHLPAGAQRRPGSFCMRDIHYLQRCWWSYLTALTSGRWSFYKCKCCD